MINPLKFVQSVKQEAFKVTWPSRKDVLVGTAMVIVLATIAAIFFLLLAGAEGLEPSASGFGDRRSTN